MRNSSKWRAAAACFMLLAIVCYSLADEGADAEKARQEKEKARIEVIDQRVQNLEKSLAEWKTKARALAPEAIKAESDPKFAAAWAEWQKASQNLLAAMAAEKSEDELKPLQAAQANATKKWNELRSFSYGELNRALAG